MTQADKPGPLGSIVQRLLDGEIGPGVAMQEIDRVLAPRRAAVRAELAGLRAVPPRSVTEHAVQRYIQRWRPGWKKEAARADLERELGGARFHEQPAGSDAIWRTPRGALLVVSGDGAVRTVLPAKSFAPNRRPRR